MGSAGFLAEAERRKIKGLLSAVTPTNDLVNKACYRFGFSANKSGALVSMTIPALTYCKTTPIIEQ